MKKLFLLLAMSMLSMGLSAQRVTDRIARGLVAVPSTQGGYLVSWRIFDTEYYDTEFNLYRNGTKIAGPLKASNYLDKSGSNSSRYQVEPIVRGVVQEKTAEVKTWAQQYLEVPVQKVLNRNGQDVTSGYSLNDISLADVDGDGTVEFLLKRRNDSGNIRQTSNKTDFNLYECYTIDGTRLWWIDLGPNMMAGPDEQWDMIGYDWDEDGKAEVIMRGADNMVIHTASGKVINIGDMTYDNGGTSDTRSEYTHVGNEYLLYLNGATGEPYGWDGTSDSFTPMAYPLPRFEEGESDYATVWGSADTGHRSSKHYFAAPYLDGRHASIFLGRGCYTRHKMCALDVNPATHELTQRWRWNCYDSKSQWFGNGFHNFAIADVDMDGRDEIVFGSMIIDDTGMGLCTTGYGHGDAQHCGDFDPYRWGLEQFTCLEGKAYPNNSYWNATTGQIYYQAAPGSDDGRCLAGNFTNDVPGGQGRSVGSGIIGLSSDKIIVNDGDSKMAWGDLNMRIYWDGDLLDEIFNSPGVERAVKITKWGNGRQSFYGGLLYSPTGALNNSSKNNPCALGDILGDWREEFVVRKSDNTGFHIYTTDRPTDYAIYTLWHDHQYRNAMVWQCVGYNQPPHKSYFLGEVEGITVAPPPLTLAGRTEIKSGATINASLNDQHLLLCEQGDATVTVASGASPYIFTDNAPVWVKGTGSNQATASTPKSPTPVYNYYTHTVNGSAFTGAMRLVKQGEGKLVLPSVEQTYTGNTDVWNGTLQFDGTLANSPLWLNRHTTLLTNGGRFLKGITADYNATINVGDGVKSSLETTELTLNFGSRVVFDIYGNDLSSDVIKAATIKLENKTWEFGPKYKAPVFQFNVHGTLTDGRYLLAEAATLEGELSEVVLEGIGDRRNLLAYEDGKLYLVVETFRQPTSVVWSGAQGDVWDFGVTENFLNNGTPDYSGLNDNVEFNDDAQLTTVRIKGAVRPASLTFNNDAKAYTINGDSILNEPTITKNGGGLLTINTENRTGNTVVNGGKLTVASLANTGGQTFGALGTVDKSITLNNATLSISSSIITDQQLYAGGDVTIEVPSSYSMTLNKGIKGTAQTVTKAGAGSLTLGQANEYDRLIIAAGSVNTQTYNNVHPLPSVVEFHDGTLYDAADENTSCSNPANFYVPEGKTGTFYGDCRCNYTGTLTGKGTFYVYGTWVRCYYKGDWSEFEGTLVPGVKDRATKPQYDPTFDFQNDKGLPKATLHLTDGFTFTKSGSGAIEIGKVTGSGTLAGSGRYILGTSGGDFTLNAKSSTAITKRGDGTMTVNVGYITAPVAVEAGTLRINESSGTTLAFGTNALTLRGTGTLAGQGRLQSVLAETGSTVYPRGRTATSTGVLRTNALMRIDQGATLLISLRSNGNCSSVEPTMLMLNGTLKVELMDSYTPKVGDEFTLWKVTSTFTGSSVTLDFPSLPAGMEWNTSSLLAKTGVLRIVAVTDGIDAIAADAVAEADVFTALGVKVGHLTTTKASAAADVQRLGLPAGTYVVRLQAAQQSGTMKVVVK